MRNAMIIMVCSLALAGVTSQNSPTSASGLLVITKDGVFNGYSAGDTLIMEECDEVALNPMDQSMTPIAHYTSALLTYVISAQVMNRPNANNQLYLVKANTQAELNRAVQHTMQIAQMTPLPVIKPRTRVEPGETSVVTIGDHMRIRIRLDNSWQIASLVDPALGVVATVAYPDDGR